MNRLVVASFLAIALLALVPQEAASEPREELTKTLPGDFPFSLRGSDSIDRVQRYTTGPLQITAVACHTASTPAATAEHYGRVLKRVPGFRATSTETSRTRDDGSTYRTHSIMGVHRYQGNISISIIETKSGRTSIDITWRRYVSAPKGAPEDWSPAVYPRRP